MVYVNWQSTKGNEFVLLAEGKKMTVSPSTHMRMTVEDGKTVVSVFNGSVDAQHGAETTLVTKKKSLTLGGDQVAVTKKIEEEPYDAWDKDAYDYHARYSQANAYAGSGYTYGISDLNYYGNFANAGAFGSFWQPYLVGQRVESILQWSLGVVSGGGLLVGVAVSVGMAAVSLGHVVVLSGVWMGLAAGRHMERVE